MAIRSNLYAQRPNKLAAGMMKTWDKQKATRRPRPVSETNPFFPYANEKESAVGALLVYGTTDKLGRTWAFRVTTKCGGTCHCCGQYVAKLRLNELGKAHLKHLKRMKQKLTH